MRTFVDDQGETWVASVADGGGGDYKGRYYLSLARAGADDGVQLSDVRWNSRRTALRTLQTMSEVELRRRLRSALGRVGRRLPV